MKKTELNLITSKVMNCTYKVGSSYAKLANQKKDFKKNDDDELDESLISLGRNIKRDGNHIYIYDDIDNETQLIIMRLVRMATRDIMTEHVGEIINGELTDTVTLHIYSPGGDAMAGFALYDFIKSSQIPIVGVIEGMCASAATLPFLACKTRIMSPNSVFLMHQLSWWDGGKNVYMQDQATNCEHIMERLRKIYLTETTIGAQFSSDEEREKAIQGLLEHDLYLGLEDCKKFGIVTEEDDDDIELSEERTKKLQDYVKNVFMEQKAENERNEADAKKKAENDKKKAEKEAKKSSGSNKKPVKKPVKRSSGDAKPKETKK